MTQKEPLLSNLCKGGFYLFSFGQKDLIDLPLKKQQWSDCQLLRRKQYNAPNQNGHLTHFRDMGNNFFREIQANRRKYILISYDFLQTFIK